MSDVIYIFCFSSAELERDADEEDIKVAYRRLAKYYHPDGESPYSSLLWYNIIFDFPISIIFYLVETC